MLTLVIGVLLGMALMYCIMTAKITGKYSTTYDDLSNHPPTLAGVQQSTTVADELYEEVPPPPVEMEIELRCNQAYGSAGSGPVGQ